jgi:hypothetical protein
VNRNERRLKLLDVAPEVIDDRLRELAQLYRLGVALRDVEWLGRRVDLRRVTERRDSREDAAGAPS